MTFESVVFSGLSFNVGTLPGVFSFISFVSGNKFSFLDCVITNLVIGESLMNFFSTQNPAGSIILSNTTFYLSKMKSSSSYFQSMFSLRNNLKVQIWNTTSYGMELMKTGIYLVIDAQEFSDSNSQYHFNYGQDGTIYHVEQQFTVAMNMKLANSYYHENQGSQGGVISLTDKIALEISNCSFIQNSVSNYGGVLSAFTNQPKSEFNSVSIKISQSTFRENNAQSGGVFNYLHSTLNVEESMNTYTNNYAYSGGVYYMTGLQSLGVNMNYYEGNFLSGVGTGTILFGKLSTCSIYLNNSEFVGSPVYNFTSVLQSLEQYHSTDYRNLNTMTIAIQSQSFTQVHSKNNKFYNFQKYFKGAIFYFSYVSFSDSNSVFYNNSAWLGGIFFCDSCELITFDSSTFKNNVAQQGGVAVFQSESFVTFTNCLFSGNSALMAGGVLVFSTRSKFNLRGCKFYYNYAAANSVIYSYETDEELSNITLCSFVNNSAGMSSTINLYKSNTNIVMSNFYNNQALSNTQNIQIASSQVTLNQVKFENPPQSNKYSRESLILGSFLNINSNVNLDIKNCQFRSGFASKGGAIFINGASNISLSNVLLHSNKANYGGAIFGSGYQNMIIEMTEFQKNDGGISGSEIYGIFSDQMTNISNSKVSNSLSSTSSFYFETLSLNVINSSMNGNLEFAEKGGAISCINCKNITVVGSLFQNYSAASGGCFYIEMSDVNKLNSSFYLVNLTLIKQIYDSEFRNCTSYQGGAIYFNNPEQVILHNSLFLNNSALNKSSTLGSGGGFAYTCTTEYDCQLIMTGKNVFQQNTADNQGGGVYWDQLEPLNVENSTFKSNSATLYGDSIACFAQKIVNISLEQYLKVKNLHSERLLVTQGTSETSSSFSNQQSGKNLPQVFMALADKYGTIVGNANNFKLTPIISTNSSEESYPPSLAGTPSFDSAGGVFNVSGITFTSNPGHNYTLLFKTDGIDYQKKSNQQYLKLVNSTSIDFTLQIGLRECLIGEQFLSNGACQICDPGSSYLLVKPTEQLTCKSCQTSVSICLGGSVIGPLPQYWRKDNLTENFLKCPNPSACLGMVSPNNNPMGECAANYYGILCGSCMSGFTKTDSFKCSQCPERRGNIVKIIFIMVGAILVLAFLIRSTLKGAKEKKNVTSIYTKILMNHLQLLLLTSSFKFKWPDQVEEFFQTSAPVSQVTQQIFSFECFVNTLKASNSTTDQNSSVFNVFYYTLLLYTTLPVILMIMSYSFWFLYSVYSKDKKVISSRAVSSLVILLFLFHPNIVKNMFDAFNCYDVDGTRRVYADLEIICYQGPHTFWSLGVALPSIIVWGLGIPLFALALMVREKDRLKTIEMKEKLGFLYNGYRHEFFYWEVIVMYRKILLVVIAVVIEQFGIITQALIVFIMLIAFVIITGKQKPYAHVALNSLEQISLIASILTVYCALFYLSDMPLIYDSDDPNLKTLDNGLRLNQGNKMFFFALIVISNLIFFMFWAFKMYSEMRSMFILKIKFVYLFFCLCGNERKYELLKQEVIKIEENEILREDFIRSIKKVKNLHSSGKLVLDKNSLEKIQVMLQPQRILNLVGQTPQIPLNEKIKFRKRELRRKIGIQQRKIWSRERKGSQLEDGQIKQTAQRLVRTSGTIVGFDESMLESREEEKSFFQRSESFPKEEDVGFETLVIEKTSSENDRDKNQGRLGNRQEKELLAIQNQHMNQRNVKKSITPITSGIQIVNINDLNEENLPVNAVIVVPKKVSHIEINSKNKLQMSAPHSQTLINVKHKSIKSRRQRKGEMISAQISIHSEDKYFESADRLLPGTFPTNQEENKKMVQQLSLNMFQSSCQSEVMQNTFGVVSQKKEHNKTIEESQKFTILDDISKKDDEQVIEAELRIQRVFDKNEFNY